MKEGEKEMRRERTWTRAERLHERRYREIRREFREGNMMTLLEQYLSSCGRGSCDRDGEGGEDAAVSAKAKRSPKRERSALPNPAGFCRFFGISRDAYLRLECEFPTEVGRMRAVFEDEALNSDLPASVLGFYFKCFLGIDGGDGKPTEEKPERGGLLVTFEHDILSDGR